MRRFDSGTGRRLPEFEPASVAVDRPTEVAVLAVFLFADHLDSGTSQLLDHRCQVCHSVVHDEILITRTEVFGVADERTPNSCFTPRPPNGGRGMIGLGIDTEMISVPRAGRFGVGGSEEHASDSGHSFHRPKAFQ